MREALSNNGKISESCDFKSASRTFSASKTPLKTKQKKTKIFKWKTEPDGRHIWAKQHLKITNHTNYHILLPSKTEATPLNATSIREKKIKQISGIQKQSHDLQ